LANGEGRQLARRRPSPRSLRLQRGKAKAEAHERSAVLGSPPCAHGEAQAAKQRCHGASWAFSWQVKAGQWRGPRRRGSLRQTLNLGANAHALLHYSAGRRTPPGSRLRCAGCGRRRFGPLEWPIAKQTYCWKSRCPVRPAVRPLREVTDLIRGAATAATSADAGGGHGFIARSDLILGAASRKIEPTRGTTSNRKGRC
jgi:hypothetical protein